MSPSVFAGDTKDDSCFVLFWMSFRPKKRGWCEIDLRALTFVSELFPSIPLFCRRLAHGRFFKKSDINGYDSHYGLSPLCFAFRMWGNWHNQRVTGERRLRARRQDHGRGRRPLGSWAAYVLWNYFPSIRFTPRVLIGTFLSTM